jgi:hypothetical protein
MKATARERPAVALVPQLCQDLAAASLNVVHSGDFELVAVEITLRVSADGKVGILGSGVGIKGDGSMKLKFVRR